MSVRPKEIAFGERYPDASGWLWRIALTTNPDGNPDVAVEGIGGDVWLPAEPEKLRQAAEALNAIADLLEPRP